MDIEILTTGENEKEYRLQVKTPTGIVHVKIRKDHGQLATASLFESWLLKRIGEELAKAQNTPPVAPGVLAGLVGQTVSVTTPALQGKGALHFGRAPF